MGRKNRKEKWIFLVNPAAGGGKSKSLFSHLEKHILSSFSEVNIRIPSSREEFYQETQEAYQKGFTHFVAIGGDGTLSLMVDALFSIPRKKKLPLPIIGNIPTGTGVDFLKSLEKEPSPLKALRSLQEKKVYKVDVGKILFLQEGKIRYFINVADAGIGGEVVYDMEKLVKKRKWHYYTISLKHLLSYSPPSIKVKIDNWWEIEGKFYLIAIANAKFFGSGMKIAPFARVDDGYFDLVLVEGGSRLKLLEKFPFIQTGKHIYEKEITYLRAKEVELIPLKKEIVRVDVDGDLEGNLPIRVSILPQKIGFLA